MAEPSSNQGSSMSTNSPTTRRGLLTSIGAGISFMGLTSASSTYPKKKIYLYLHIHDGCNGEDQDVAQLATDSLRDQFNDYFDGFEMRVFDQSIWSGNDSRSYLENNWESIPEVVDPSYGNGIPHFIVSDFFNDIGASDHGYGHSIRNLTSDKDGATVTNVGAVRQIDGLGPAKNLVIHETLHSLNVRHEHGEVDTTSTSYTNVSPMATSYVRSSIIPGTSDITFQGTGAVPSEFCNGTNNNKALTFAGDHTKTISSCSFLQAYDHLHSEYDVDYPGGGGCTPQSPYCQSETIENDSENSTTNSRESP
jgi:hypothetical protein